MITNIIIIAVIIGAGAFLLLTLIKKDSKFSDFGIKLGSVSCPKCNQKQPIIRKPKNKRQALYGGYTCNNCDTEMDKYGTEVK